MARDKKLFEELLALIEENSTDVDSLDFSQNGLDDADIKRLSQALKSNTALTSLKLENNLIGNEGAQALAEMLKVNSTIVSINLMENDVGHDGVWYLSEALKVNNTLKSLDLSWNKIYYRGAEFLATMLRSNNTLLSLNLQNSELHEVGAEAIAAALKTNNTLTSLMLGDNSIGRAGYSALSAGLRSNNTLTFLELQKNSFWLGGMEAIAEALSSNTTLTSLNLHTCSIGKAEAKVLTEALKKNKTLTFLNLQGNSFSAEIQTTLDEILKENAKSAVEMAELKKKLQLPNEADICILKEINPLLHNNLLIEPFSYAASISPSLPEPTIDIPEYYYCPLTKKLFLKAVVAEDGETYEEEAIKTYLENNTTSPTITGEPLSNKTLLENRSLQRNLDKFLSKYAQAQKWRYIPIQAIKAVEAACREANVENLQNWLAKHPQLITFCVFANETPNLLDFIITQTPINIEVLLPVLAKNLTRLDWRNLLEQKSAIEWLTCITHSGENNQQVALDFLRSMETGLSLDGLGPTAFALEAMRNGQPWLFRLAIMRLESINIPIDDKGNTLLHIAVTERQPHALQILLAEGNADVTHHNQANITAKGLARRSGYQQEEHIITAFKVAPLLIQYGYRNEAERLHNSVMVSAPRVMNESVSPQKEEKTPGCKTQ